ncbi:MAG TPA: twin-arginine translocase subunit TatC [Bacillota bacterium]|nr:twin-arginine translocase subunit TatC [Bacillota bacterium]
MAREESKMTVIEHLNELRKRLFVVLISVVLVSLVSLVYAARLLDIISMGLPLIYIRPSEAFMAHVRIAVTTGLTACTPIIFYNIAAYLMPAFTKREKRLLILGVFLMLVLFFSGIYFAWAMVFPLAMDFFANFATDTLTPYYTVGDYVSFATSFFLAFGLVFQLPVVFWVLGALGMVTARTLRSVRKYSLIVIMILAAFLTPPDVVSQMLLAMPMLVLYEFGIVLVAISERGRRRRAAASDKE